MAWEWGTNEYFYLPYVTIMWCPRWKLPKDRGKKIKLIFLASKELSWISNLGSTFLKLDYHQWLKVHTFVIWEIQTSRRIQHVGIYCQIVCYLKKKLSRDLCSPSRHQLLWLQLFTKFLKIFGPSFWFCLAGLLISFV